MMKKLILLVVLAVCWVSVAMAGTVSGTVTKGSTGNAAYPATVYLIKKSYSSQLAAYTLTLLDSTVTNSNGEYHFYNVTVPAGDLLVKAALDASNPDYSHYLPTYKENSLTWNNAHAVSFTLGANNIHLIHGINPGGPAFIGGSVKQGANKSTGVGDPLPARLIILTTVNGDAVAFTYSDASGNFSFPNLAYGSYKLFGDVWGKQNPELLVNVDAVTPTVNDIIFQENSQNFAGSATGINDPAINTSIKAYPNPVKDRLVVSIPDASDMITSASLTDLKGQVVYTRAFNATTVSIPMEDLPGGLYLLNVSSVKGITHLPIMKQ
jgi:hypothetical protein